MAVLVGRILLVLVAASLLASPVPAVTLDHLGYTSFYVLGDSTSDTGNLHRLTLGREAAKPYWRGRFSNGPVWSDHVARHFREAKVRTGNFALGGAKATGGATDLGNQVSRYRLVDRGKRGSRPLLALWAGGNDIKAKAGKARIERVGRRAANAVGEAIASLSRAHVRDFVVFRMPDVGKIPFFLERPSRAGSASKGTAAFNKRLDQRVEKLRGRGLNIHVVDAHALFAAMIADPGSFGVRDVTTPCLDARRKLCTATQARHRAFFDQVHANYVVHERLAEAALAEIAGAEPLDARLAFAAASTTGPAVAPAPVPLPAPAALLLGGLLALGAAWRRRSLRRP